MRGRNPKSPAFGNSARVVANGPVDLLSRDLLFAILFDSKRILGTSDVPAGTSDDGLVGPSNMSGDGSHVSAQCFDFLWDLVGYPALEDG